MKFDNFKRNFATPDMKYAVYPIIHDKTEDMSCVDYYERCGFAGIVGNVNYTRKFPNDTEKWQGFEKGIRSYIDKGLHTWIYDEKGYPSGSAGGYVTESHPEFVAKGIYCYNYWNILNGPCQYRADIPLGDFWKAFLVPINGGEEIDITDTINENNVLYFDVPEGKFYLFIMCIRRLFDGTHASESFSEPRNYISLSDKKAVDAFIECTHEKYKERLSDEFGKGIVAMFTDEPSLISFSFRGGDFPILPWLESYPEGFKARFGYDFSSACISVVTGLGTNPIKKRCDFWDFIADTVAESYFGNIANWCHKNNLKFSGHMLEEERLQAHVFMYGSFYRCMKKFDWPGIDQLQTEAEFLMDHTGIPIARFISSFADISGENEVFTEFSDHCVKFRGEIAPPENYYLSVNWHLAMGVNNFTSYYTFKGFTEEMLREYNLYTARCGYLLRQGRRDSKVAVYYPEASMWAAYTPSTGSRAVDDSEEILALEDSFEKVSWALIDNQIDYDYIDSQILSDCDMADGSLFYRNRKYNAVIFPCTKVLEEKILEKAIHLSSKGIIVVFCDALPEISRETGEPLPLLQELTEQINEGKILFCNSTELKDKFATDTFRTIHNIVIKGKNSENILSHSRVTNDNERIVFLASMCDRSFEGEVYIPGEYAEIALADAKNGTINSVEVEKTKNGFKVNIKIEPNESIFIILK